MASSVINSDDGVISGTAGLKSVGGDDGALAVQSNGTEVAKFKTTELVINDGGANYDFRVEGDTNANMLFVDASADRVGIGTNSLNTVCGILGNGADGLDLLPNVANTAQSTRLFLSTATAGQACTLLNNGGDLVFTNSATPGSASGTERARITSGGYLRVSNSGSYNEVTGSSTVHYIQNDVSNNSTLYLIANNNSYTNEILQNACLRSANSAYSFFKGVSGNGSTAFADNEFNLRGDGNAFADGTWSNNGADYAEFFESANGQALTLGATVVLDGNKVREATEQDPASAVIGVVRPKEPSKASMIIGNTAWNKWANKYLSDDFDRYIMEDHDVVEWTDEEGKFHSYESQAIPEGITVPADATRKTHDDKGNKFQHYKLNPAWNPDSEYVNRENRTEWNIIGLLGQVKILKNQPVGDRWVKMRDVSDTVEEWFIR
jgi:hypothetical protein